MSGVERMTDRQAFQIGWGASKRTRTFDLEAAIERFEKRANVAQAGTVRRGELVHLFDAGWCSYSADGEPDADLERAVAYLQDVARRTAQAQGVLF